MKLKKKYARTHTHTVAHNQQLSLWGIAKAIAITIASNRFDLCGLVWFGFANINHLSVEINN